MFVDILNEPKPEYLYKYSRISPHTFEQIKESYLWFSDKDNLNDPFDLNYQLEDNMLDKYITLSTQHIKESLSQELGKYGKTYPRCIDKILKEMIGDEEFRKRTHDFVSTEIFRYKVCCFTTSYLNELMWAHYGNSHKGICFKYDFSHSTDIYKCLYPVHYSDERFNANSVQEIIPTLLQKSKRWECEEEWRILNLEEGKTPIQKNCLKEIIFGCKASIEDVEKIKVCCKQNNYQIEYSRITSTGQNYELRKVSC